MNRPTRQPTIGRITGISLGFALGLVLSAPAQKPATLPPGVVAQGDHYVSQADGAEMVYIPPGTCVIGLTPAGFPGADGTRIEASIKPASDSDIFAASVRVAGAAFFQDVLPATNLFVNGFFMDRYEVSNRRYKKFIDATKHTAPVPLPAYANAFYAAFTWPKGSWYTSADPIYDGAEYPVSCVTWADAMAYAGWAGKTLPTEVQWERAARGTNNWSFPWGEQWIPANANTAERGDRATRVCGATTNDRSTFGVMDMAGNVSEWTADPWSATTALPEQPGTNAPPVAATTNTVPPAAVTTTTNAFHVVKGGNWGYMGFIQSRNWSRRSNADEAALVPGPVPQSVTIGFRCVIPAP